MRRAFSGFTLVEMIISITLIGILGALMAGFLRVPLKTYEDISRRSTLTDVADRALRRVSRDVREALPNSVRVSTVGGVVYLEYLQVRTGGRYRRQPGAASVCPVGGLGVPFNDALEVGVVDGCFTAFGNVPNRAQVANTDWLVLYNLGTGYAGADAYFGGNVAVAGGNKTRINSTAAGAGAGAEDRFNLQPFAFPLESPSARFHVVSGPVTYACDPATGTLRRFWGYPISVAQPTPPLGGQSAILADGFTACTITYDANVLAQRNGLVSIRLVLARADPDGSDQERLSLFQQAQVSNSP
jgi:MSHA biogenesis protein MshO